MTVHFVVRAFEKAGMAALMFEDQVWPKRCGHMAGKIVHPAEEMVQKVKAAVDARRDHDFVIVSRTDAAGPHGVDEAIRRLNLYAEAGADVHVRRRAAVEGGHRQGREKRAEAADRQHGSRHALAQDDAADVAEGAAGHRRRRRSAIRACCRPPR